MILILKKNTSQQDITSLKDLLLKQGFTCSFLPGQQQDALAILGNTYMLDASMLKSLPFVSDVKRISRPYELVARGSRQTSTFRVGHSMIGKDFVIMAGPCAIESEAQLLECATGIKENADVLRGGLFKPRTSPYTFQGIGKEGTPFIRKAKEATDLPFIAEITDISQLPFMEDVDILQIGARNMQNFELLHAVGQSGKPVLLKRGMSATLEEFLLSAEHIMKCGNENIILCERGIRTFSQEMRATLDISSIPFLKKETHLPVFADPSHAAGNSEFVPALALAATAAGCDGLLIEVHSDPAVALSDGAQQLSVSQFNELSQKVRKLHSIL